MSDGALRPELSRIVDELVAAAEGSREVSLDDVGDAVGARAVSYVEIDLMIAAIEARGVRVTGPEGGGGEERLRRVLVAARELASELGRRPSVVEIAARASLTEEQVRHALALARVMQR